jgi:hypothetical protein
LQDIIVLLSKLFLSHCDLRINSPVNGHNRKYIIMRKFLLVSISLCSLTFGSALAHSPAFVGSGNVQHGDGSSAGTEGGSSVFGEGTPTTPLASAETGNTVATVVTTLSQGNGISSTSGGTTTSKATGSAMNDAGFSGYNNGYSYGGSSGDFTENFKTTNPNMFPNY